MKPWRFLTVLLVTAFLLIPVFQGNAAPTTEPSAQAGSDIHEAITTAVMDLVEKHTDVLAFQLFHMQVYQIFLAEDEKQAVIWLAGGGRGERRGGGSGTSVGNCKPVPGKTPPNLLHGKSPSRQMKPE